MVYVLYIVTKINMRIYITYVTSSFQAKYKKAIYVYINISVQRSTFCVCAQVSKLVITVPYRQSDNTPIP